MIETPRTTMISDALLNALGHEYQVLGLKHFGVEFHEFVVAPERGRDLIREADSYRPLLPEQRAVQERLDEQELEAEVEAAERDLLRDRPDTRCRGGAFTEPLHHHAYGHDRRRSLFRRQGDK